VADGRLKHFDERWGFNPGRPDWQPCLAALLLAATLWWIVGCATAPEPPPTEQFTPAEMRALLCEGGDTKIGGRSVNIEISSLPCTALKTRLAIADSQGRGFWAGGVTRFFLRTRLVARGVFSTVFGMVGLG